MGKITKEDLSGRGIEVPETGERYTMKHSWHVPEKVKFATDEEVGETCFDSKKKIKKGDFVSIGHRQIEPSKPIDVEGLDVSHWSAAFGGELGDALKKYGGKDIRKIAGFSELTRPQQLKYLKAAGQATAKELAEMEPPKQAFTGVQAVFAGGFIKREELIKKIEDNGGKVISSVSKNCNVLILGTSKKTKAASKIGKSSPKYKQAKKQGAKIVRKRWIDQVLEAFKKSGKNALDVPAPSQEELDQQEKEDEEEAAKHAEVTGNLPGKRKREASDKPAAEPAEKKQRKIEVDKLKDMKRGELQTLAKDYGISAKLKNDEMIEKLKEAAK